MALKNCLKNEKMRKMPLTLIEGYLWVVVVFGSRILTEIKILTFEF